MPSALDALQSGADPRKPKRPPAARDPDLEAVFGRNGASAPDPDLAAVYAKPIDFSKLPPALRAEHERRAALAQPESTLHALQEGALGLVGWRQAQAQGLQRANDLAAGRANLGQTFLRSIGDVNQMTGQAAMTPVTAPYAAGQALLHTVQHPEDIEGPEAIANAFKVLGAGLSLAPALGAADAALARTPSGAPAVPSPEPTPSGPATGPLAPAPVENVPSTTEALAGLQRVALETPRQVPLVPTVPGAGRARPQPTPQFAEGVGREAPPPSYVPTAPFATSGEPHPLTQDVLEPSALPLTRVGAPEELRLDPDLAAVYGDEALGRVGGGEEGRAPPTGGGAGLVPPLARSAGLPPNLALTSAPAASAPEAPRQSPYPATMPNVARPLDAIRALPDAALGQTPPLEASAAAPGVQEAQAVAASRSALDRERYAAHTAETLQPRKPESDPLAAIREKAATTQPTASPEDALFLEHGDRFEPAPEAGVALRVGGEVFDGKDFQEAAMRAVKKTRAWPLQDWEYRDIRDGYYPRLRSGDPNWTTQVEHGYKNTYGEFITNEERAAALEAAAKRKGPLGPLQGEAGFARVRHGPLEPEDVPPENVEAMSATGPVGPAARLAARKAAAIEDVTRGPPELAGQRNLTDAGALRGQPQPFEGATEVEPRTRAEALAQYAELTTDPDSPPLPKSMRQLDAALRAEVEAGRLNPEEAARKLFEFPEQMAASQRGKKLGGLLSDERGFLRFWKSRKPPLEVAPKAAVSRVKANELAATELPPLPPELLDPARIAPPSVFNVARMGMTSPEGEAALGTTVQRAAAAARYTPRPVVHFPEAEAQARQLATDPGKLLRIDAKRITGTERLAIRIAATVGTDREVALQHQLDTGALDPKARGQLEVELRSQQLLNQELIQHGMESGTAQGRDQAFNRIYALHTLDPVAWFRRAQQVRGELPLTDAHRAQISALIAAKDVAGLADYVAGLRKFTNAEKAAALWRTNLISALGTVTKIGVSNVAQLTTNALAKPGAVVLDRVAGAVSGIETRTPLGASLWDAATRAATETYRGLGQIARGKNPDVGPQGTAGGAFNFRTPEFETPVIGDLANFYMKAVMRVHRGAHYLTWQPTYQAALFEQAKILARAAGERDPGAVAKLAANPSTEMQVRAIEAANRATFVKPNVLARGLSGMSDYFLTHGGVAGKAAYVATTWAVPFARISANLVEAGAELSPLGFAMAVPNLFHFFKLVAEQRALPEGLERAATRTKLSDVQYRLTGQLAKAGLGSAAAFGVGYYLGKAGLMTGPVPDTPEEKLMWEAQGRTPFSVPVGKSWRNVLALGPWGLSMAMGSAFAHATHDPSMTPTEKAEQWAVTTFEAAGQESFLTSIKDVAQLARGEMGPAQLAQQSAGEVVPNLVAKAAQATDRYQRDPQNVVEQIESRLPGLSHRVQPKLGRTGQPLTRTQSPLSTFGNPFYTRAPDPGLANLHLSPALLTMSAVQAAMEKRLTKLNNEYAKLTLSPPEALGSARKGALLADVVRRMRETVEAGQRELTSLQQEKPQ